MLVELAEQALRTVGVRGIADLGIVLMLFASALYWRKLLFVAGKGKSLGSKLVFALVVVAVLAVLGVVDPRPDVAADLLRQAWQLVRDHVLGNGGVLAISTAGFPVVGRVHDRHPSWMCKRYDYVCRDCDQYSSVNCCLHCQQHGLDRTATEE